MYPAGGYVEPITTNATQVMNHTAGWSSEIFDKNDIEIFEGDIVRFFGMTGVVVREAGAFGVSSKKTINYDVLEKNIPSPNNPAFCYNDNFISLWELIWNYSSLEDTNKCDVIEVIGNKFDNPELL